MDGCGCGIIFQVFQEQHSGTRNFWFSNLSKSPWNINLLSTIKKKVNNLISGYFRVCDMSTLNNPWCQELFQIRHNRSCNSDGRYLFVEAQGSEGLFDGCEVFPALSRGSRYSRALPWKASAKISRVRVEGWSNDFKTEQNSNTRLKLEAVVLMKRVLKIPSKSISIHDFNFHHTEK